MGVDFTFRAGEGVPLAALCQNRNPSSVFWSEALGVWAVPSYAAMQEIMHIDTVAQVNMRRVKADCAEHGGKTLREKHHG